MDVPLSSPLIVRTVAVIGIGAIAMAPVTAAPMNLPSVPLPSLAQVALVGFHSPLSQLLGTVDLASQYILNGTSDVTSPASWPGADFGTEFGVPPVNLPGIVPGILGPYNPANPPYGAFGTDVFTFVGILPQIIVDALPMLSQLGINGSNYLNVTGNALTTAGIAPLPGCVGRRRAGHHGEHPRSLGDAGRSSQRGGHHSAGGGHLCCCRGDD